MFIIILGFDVTFIYLYNYGYKSEGYAKMAKTKKKNWRKLAAASNNKKKTKMDRMVKLVAIAMVFIMLASVVISLMVSLSTLN